MEAKASTSYDNNDYVIWAACGLAFGGKQLTHVSCQRFQNVSLSIRWENVGKKAGDERLDTHARSEEHQLSEE